MPSPILTTWILTSYSAMTGKLWSTAAVLIKRPLTSISLDTWRSAWLASDLQQTLTWWTKLSLPG